MNTKYTIKRHLENKINSLLVQFKCLVLTGPRQVGKSTLLKAILPNIHNFNYVKLDNPKIKLHANNDPEDFLQQYKRPLFIDEIQKTSILFEYIKDIVDDNDLLGQFVVTGSESFELIKGVKEFLSTRAVLVEMNSLSQSEINKKPNFMFRPIPKLIRERRQPKKDKKNIFFDIIKGSMPDIINGNVKDIQSYYKTYSKTTLLADIKDDLIKIQDNKKYEKFLRALASLVGQEINYSTIARLSDIDYKTAMN
jgi:predicted AAA+ superfamily ATPase